jgi:hypothetical protein
MTWQRNIPDTKVSRIELLSLLVQAHRDIQTANYPSEGRRTFAKVASLGVLSAQQLSILYEYARPYVYERMRSLGIPIPDKDHHGWVDPRGLEKLKIVVMCCSQDEPIPEEVLNDIPKCGKRGIVRFLTGYDYQTGELS